MTKSLRTMTLGAALVAGFAASAAAQAPQGQTPGQGERVKERTEQVGRHGGRFAGGRMGRALFRGIELTEQQRAQIRTIGEKYRPQYQELRKANRERAEGRRQRPDSATMAQFRTLAERQRGEVRAVLTPEQQTVFDQNVARMAERAREWRARRG